MSNVNEEYVSEPIVDIQGVRIETTFDPLFLETEVPLVPFQESRGVPAKEVLRESAQSPKPFDAHTLRSKLSSYDLKLLRERCEILPIIKLRLPDENESANMTTIDEIGVYWDMFINGFKVPLHPFFIKVLNAYGLAPGQFSPHAWRFMSFFIYQCHKLGLNPRTRACNKLREMDLSETDLEHIGKLKEAKPLESRYPLNNAQLSNMSSRAQGDPPLFNALGVLGDIIPDELASIHGLEEEEMQDLDFGALVSGSQPKATETQTENFVLGLTSVDKSKETSKKRKSRAELGVEPHHPPFILIPRIALPGEYLLTKTANGMVQLMSQAMAQVQIGAEKLIAADKVLDEEKKKVMIENNFRREAEKKVEDLSKKVERLELSNAGMTPKNAELSAHRLRDSKGALVHGYNECKTNVSKDHPELDMSIYEHKFAREVALETERRAEEAERKKAASSRMLTSPSVSRSLGASGQRLWLFQGRNCLWLKATLKRWSYQ
ncbi:hypothetical protein RJ639_019139 [Escallonia herrerae]|uniref:Transposase (putative) gypsy type domain-containing protein n=1 Tax=Escallonia herrerae TaxID=1293975 RepID=A0AA89AKK2_9ASTE|nr:hypothetical protein RJ639_019139 [Escallonia herrerae]